MLASKMQVAVCVILANIGATPRTQLSQDVQIPSSTFECSTNLQRKRPCTSQPATSLPQAKRRLVPPNTSSPIQQG